MLNLNISAPSPSTSGREPCGPASLGLFQLLGHSPPYPVWYNIGDPDEEMGRCTFAVSPESRLR